MENKFIEYRNIKEETILSKKVNLIKESRHWKKIKEKNICSKITIHH